MDVSDRLKSDVRDFWERVPCGEVYATGGTLADQLRRQAEERFKLEPYIAHFARFHEGRGRDVLEIGVGMGADHLAWAKADPKLLIGIDLTRRAVQFTRARLTEHGLPARALCADAEALPFPDECFDMVYSWGVLHHSPDTPAAIHEVFRVLRRGGKARIMLYHKYSIVGFLLWLRYGAMRGRPSASLDEMYSRYLESPGTKAYSVEDARVLFSRFQSVEIKRQLSFGDLLQGAVGQRHNGFLVRLTKRAWPRSLIRATLPNSGLYLLIEASR